MTRRDALGRGVALIGHCALEAYSVLTRLPAPHRAPGAVVRDFLRASFASPYLQLTVAQYRAFVENLPDHDVPGSVAYDALVAVTAAASGAELVTCDRRALPIYERYGVRALVVA